MNRARMRDANDINCSLSISVHRRFEKKFSSMKILVLFSEDRLISRIPRQANEFFPFCPARMVLLIIDVTYKIIALWLVSSDVGVVHVYNELWAVYS